MSRSRRASVVAFAIALLAPLLALANPAKADVSGNWAVTAELGGTDDCTVSWSGQSSYTLRATSILKITLTQGQTDCSLTIKGTDLSTWQISTDQGVSWTTLFGTFEGLPAYGGTFPRQVWFRVGTTSAIIGSGDYSGFQYGVNFQIPVISITPILDPGDAEFTFWLPDGRECTSISPVSVAIDSFYTLPEPGVDCRTTSGAEILGWKVGWDDIVHPPGRSVLVIDSQRFTAVLKEEVLTVDFDANVAAADGCFAGTTNVPVQQRTLTQEVDREDLADYRIMVDPICIPLNHYFAGWSTTPAVESDDDLLALGAKAPTDWSTTTANTATLYAQWKPQRFIVIDVRDPKAIPELTPVQVFVGNATPGPGALQGGVVTLTSYAQIDSFTTTSDAMDEAILDFFTNGGTSLSIVPAAGSDAASLTAAIESIDVPAALDIAAPELRGLTPADWLQAAGALVDKAESLRAIAWIDPPAATVSAPQAQAVGGLIGLAAQLHGQVGGDETAGTLLGGGVVNSSGDARAASPGVLGARASADNMSGVWSGMGSLNGLVGVTSEIDPSMRQAASLQISGVSPIVDFFGGRTVVAPGVTLDRTVRTSTQRFQDWLVQSITAGLTQFEDYPNGPDTRGQMISVLSQFLNNVWSQGGLNGMSADQAYQVKCTATEQQIEEGLIECTISASTTYPGIFYTFTIDQKVEPFVPSPGEDAT